MNTKLVLIFLVGMSSIIYSCGYVENDKTEIDFKIVGNIKITKQEGNEEYNLIYAEKDNVSDVIVQNCKIVYYDSLKKTIFAESILNKFNSNYFKIIIINEWGELLSNSVNSQMVTKKEFLDRTKAMSNKWILQY